MSCTIGMLLLPGFNALAAQALLDPFRAANYLRGRALYRWPLFSPDGGEVMASNGFAVSGTAGFCQASIAQAPDALDILVVNASWAPERFRGRRLQNRLRHLARQGTVLAGLDTGAFVLAYAGLLSGYRAAMHYEHLASFRELFPESQAAETLFVFDRDRLTCCGGMAAGDMALEIIRLQQGLDLANAAARYIFHDRLRPGEESQRPNGREPVGAAVPRQLRGAIILMERNLEQPIKIGAIAGRLGLSQRQLERLFQSACGVTPLRYYLDLRLDRARGLVTQTDLPMVDVAAACGFANAAQLARTYRQRFGLPPSRDRIDGRVPFQFRAFPSHAGL